MVTVTNVGDRAGRDVVQLYARAESPDQARPVQELTGFERVSLDAGESVDVTFEVSATQLAYHDRELNLTVHEGPYELRVGHSAADLVTSADPSVTDSKVVPRTGRTYFAKTHVDSA